MATAKKPADPVAGEEQAAADAGATDAATQDTALADVPADTPVDAPAEEAAADAGATDAGEPAADTPVIDPEIAALNAGLIALTHPQGGTCDRYETAQRGDVTVILVPANEATDMFEHGFVLAEA